MEKNRSKIAAIFIAFTTMMLVIISCQKDVGITSDTGINVNNARALSIYLTDDPCFYDSLLVDIRQVEVKIDTSSHRDDDHYGDDDDDDDDDHNGHDNYGNWDTLRIQAGVYSILELRNGLDTLLASGNIPASAIRKIRITLGTNNSIVVNGTRKSLQLFPGANNYVYIKINREHQSNTGNNQTTIWLDFDVCESIKEIGNQYFLKPSIKAFNKENFGEIEGKVLPAAARAVVTATSAADNGTAIPFSDGKYKIRGLKAGTYTVLYSAQPPYRDTTITNVVVRNNRETELPTITLRQ